MLHTSHYLRHFGGHILFIPPYTPGMTNPDFKLSPDLIPSDGRFVCGPSKVRQAQIDAVVDGAHDVSGTSHRQPAVKYVVGEVRDEIGRASCREGGMVEVDV